MIAASSKIGQTTYKTSFEPYDKPPFKTKRDNNKQNPQFFNK